MIEEREPDSARLLATRNAVQSFIVKKRNRAKALLVATLAAEALFLALMLLNMDFASRLERFLLFGFLLVYAPLVLFSWHNSVKLDHVFYRLLDELKYGDRERP